MLVVIYEGLTAYHGAYMDVLHESQVEFFSLYVMYCVVFNTASSAPPPSDSTVSEDAGIEPRIVTTSALAVRRSNH